PAAKHLLSASLLEISGAAMPTLLWRFIRATVAPAAVQRQPVVRCAGAGCPAPLSFRASAVFAGARNLSERFLVRATEDAAAPATLRGELPVWWDRHSCRSS